MYIKSIQFDSNNNHNDFEINIEAIDYTNIYFIRMYASQQEKFVKFIKDNSNFIENEIDESHWICKILKENIYKIEPKQNLLIEETVQFGGSGTQYTGTFVDNFRQGFYGEQYFVPLGEYDYGNSYNDFEFIKNIEKTKKEIARGLTIPQKFIKKELKRRKIIL